VRGSGDARVPLSTRAAAERRPVADLDRVKRESARLVARWEELETKREEASRPS
jgi:hypothetical protein